MKIQFKCMVILSLFLSGVMALGQDEGEKLFKQVCVACHTINDGKLVGPDLAGVHLRRSEEWLLKFIRSSQSVVQTGDPVAVALFEEFNKIPMPDNAFTEDQIRKIIAYIASNSPGGPGAAGTGGVSPATGKFSNQSLQGDASNGEKLFTGNVRLSNGGPSCISCHNVKNDKVITGGILAKDLTDVYTRLTAAGVQAIIGNPPFPAMSQAYPGKSLQAQEISDITAFLKLTDDIKKNQEGTNYGLTLLLSGLCGAVVLLLIFKGIHSRSKRGSINQHIYDRQLKSI
ncbi:MAG: hypothetical protein DWQ05_18005 [Calditrichaeota bacterium]|nr:MAG: hypothetical protein DWQ05_18005 [Calditrichota bacterium]